MGWMVGVRFLVGARDFSLVRSVQTDSGAHPVSYPMGTGGCFHGGGGVTLLGREADSSGPPSAEVKSGGAIPPLPPTS
jgi:hypothetical protein